MNNRQLLPAEVGESVIRVGQDIAERTIIAIVADALRRREVARPIQVFGEPMSLVSHSILIDPYHSGGFRLLTSTKERVTRWMCSVLGATAAPITPE